MDISLIKNHSFIKNQALIANSTYRYQPQKDSVSFTSKSLVNYSFGENIKPATILGKQIYNKFSKGASKEEIVKLIQQEHPNLKVKSMEELDIEDKSLYFAYYTHKISSGFTPFETELFVDIKNSNNPILNMLCASDIAHEYTHIIQSYNPKTIAEYKALSNGDKEYLDLVAGFGDSVFKYFDTEEQARMAMGGFDKYDTPNMQRYGRLAPRKNDINKNMLIAKSPYGSEKEFRANVNHVLNVFLDKMCIELLTLPDNQVLPHLKEKFKQIKQEGRLDELKAAVRKYVEISAQKEKEAYATEAQVAREILGTKESLNIDALPIYYQMLENAFKLG